MLTQTASIGRKLWLITGVAVTAGAAVLLLNLLVPSLRPESPLVLILVGGIWAATGLAVLAANAQRIQQVVVLSALALTVALSLATRWFGFAGFVLGYLGVILYVGTVMVRGTLRLFRRKPALRVLLLPRTMILAGACGVVLSAWSSRPAPPIPQKAMSASGELQYIHDTDQADRFTMYMLIDPERDRIRLDRVKALYRAGKIAEPLDQYNAGMVYQHGSCADDYYVAYELFQKAELGRGVPKSYPPLSHLAFDRWQLALGKRQTYGTQWFPVPIRRPCAPER